MTFSIAGRCARTGMLGAVVTTSSMAVGGRCAYARPRIGAVLTQHRTDPRLGPKMLDGLQQEAISSGKDIGESEELPAEILPVDGGDAAQAASA